MKVLEHFQTGKRKVYIFFGNKNSIEWLNKISFMFYFYTDGKYVGFICKQSWYSLNIQFQLIQDWNKKSGKIYYIRNPTAEGKKIWYIRDEKISILFVFTWGFFVNPIQIHVNKEARRPFALNNSLSLAFFWFYERIHLVYVKHCKSTRIVSVIYSQNIHSYMLCAVQIRRTIDIRDTQREKSSYNRRKPMKIVWIST